MRTVYRGIQSYEEFFCDLNFKGGLVRKGQDLLCNFISSARIPGDITVGEKSPDNDQIKILL